MLLVTMVPMQDKEGPKGAKHAPEYAKSDKDVDPQVQVAVWCGVVKASTVTCTHDNHDQNPNL